MSKFKILFQYSSKLIIDIFMTSSLRYNKENGIKGVCLIINQKKYCIITHSFWSKLNFLLIHQTNHLNNWIDFSKKNHKNLQVPLRFHGNIVSKNLKYLATCLIHSTLNLMILLIFLKTQIKIKYSLQKNKKKLIYHIFSKRRLLLCRFFFVAKSFSLSKHIKVKLTIWFDCDISFLCVSKKIMCLINRKKLIIDFFQNHQIKEYCRNRVRKTW